jgi:hypothetical protein
MWRWIEKGQLSEGSYPAHASRLFPLLQGIKKVDAAFERESDGSIVFISGTGFFKKRMIIARIPYLFYIFIRKELLDI